MKITADELKEWQRLDGERRELERKANTIKERCEQIRDKAAGVLKESGKQSIIRFGFTLAWQKGRAVVSWKDAFLSECGPEKASKLQDEAAKNAKQSLSITAPAIDPASAPAPAPRAGSTY